MPTNRDQFLALVQRYLDGTCSPEEKQVMDYWYDLLDVEIVDETNADTRKAQEEAVWEKIQQLIQAQRIEQLPVRRWWQSGGFQWTAAALVILLAGLVYYNHTPAPSPTQSVAYSAPVQMPARLWEESNPGKASRVVVLEDGSRIRLEPGSRVQYPKPFASFQRVVYLTGNAFFEVTKNPAKPFSVYTGAIVTKVVGTSFRIQSSSAHFELAVVTGKVIVEKADKTAAGHGVVANHRVVLTPNQKVTYSANQDQFVTALVARPVPVKPLPEPVLVSSLQFEETPLVSVLEKLEELYGIEIVLTNEAIQNCPITADLSPYSLYPQLEIVCAALKARFEVQGTRIVLAGGSCY